MTPAIAAQYLQDERIPLRSFRDVLREMYPYPDLALRLVSAFQGDDASRSASRKVNNRLSGASRPTDREDVFRIAFALDLSEDQANRLPGMCTEYGIHYRNGRDAVYAWCLRRDMGYPEAGALFESLPDVPPPAGSPPDDPCAGPRSAFDWLVLYSLTAGGDESMSERTERVIDKLYEDVR